MTWQSIETAPKMRVILLWAKTSSEPNNWEMATGFFSEGHNAWIWNGITCNKSYHQQPTHWHDLPEPPNV